MAGKMEKRSLFFDTSLIYFIVIVLFVGLRIFSSLVPVNGAGSAILSIIIQVGFMLLVPFFMYKFLRKKKTKEILNDFNVKKIGFKAVFIAVMLGVLVYVLNLAVASFFGIFINATGYDPSFGMASSNGDSYPLIAFLGDLVITALLPGICEEFCHRGLLTSGYKQIGSRKNIILVGLLFGLMHLNIEQFFYASVIGMFLTFLVYLTGSIIPSIIIHFMNNGIGLYMAFAEKNDLFLGNVGESIKNALNGNPLTVFGTILLVVLLMLGLLILFTFLLLKHTRVKEFRNLAKKALDAKQRETILESFGLDVEELNKEQGIIKDENEPEVVINPQPVFTSGRPGFILDFKFNKSDLMNCNIKKTTLKDRTFLYAVTFIGIAVTVCTLIWGIL